MKRTSISKLHRPDGMSPTWTAGSRLALLLTAVVIVIMPLTEHFWHFDKFLRGGQDFELGLLCIATVICLVLVLMQHGKRAVTQALAVRRWLSLVFRYDHRVTAGSILGLAAFLRIHAMLSPSVGRCSLPLQV